MSTEPIEYDEDNQPDPIRWDVTDSGLVVGVTDEQGLDLTVLSQKTNARRANFADAIERLVLLQAEVPAMLAELRAAHAELGEPCGICEGGQGHYVEVPDGPEWVECEFCAGSGIRQLVAV